MPFDSFVIHVSFRTAYTILLLFILFYNLVALKLGAMILSRTVPWLTLLTLAVTLVDLLVFNFGYWWPDGYWAARLNLAYELLLFGYVPLILLLTREQVDPRGRAYHILGKIILASVGMTFLVLVVAMSRPELLAALEAPWNPTWRWNIGRGRLGPLTQLRDLMAFGSLLALGAAVARRAGRRQWPQSSVAVLLAILVNFIIGFDAIWAKFFGDFLVLSQVVFPRFLTGVIVFIVVYSASDLVRFIQKSLDTDRALAEVKSGEEKLIQLAYYDPLTGLPNRKNFFEKIELLCLENQRVPRVMALLFLDFDLFRIANETLGHHGGDQILKEAALRIRQSLRSSDHLFRLEGDEFMVILTGLNSPSDAGLVAQKLLSSMDQPLEVGLTRIHLTLSIGISVMPRDGRTAMELYRKADEALRDAKRERNTFRFYSTSLNVEANRKLHLLETLRYAVPREMLRVFYQPVHDRSGRIVEAEALIRLVEGGEHLLPGTFLPVAENSGLIQSIGTWMLGRVFQDCLTFRREGYSLPVSVNLSPAQLRDANVVALWDSLTQETGLGPRDILLELRERIFMEKDSVLEANTKALLDRGLSFILDDFGGGSSNFAFLMDFPLRGLKIDRSFVKVNGASPKALEVTRQLLRFARSLAPWVVMKGIESAAERDFFHGEGVDAFQGYFYARPMALSEFLAYLRTGKLEEAP